MVRLDAFLLHELKEAIKSLKDTGDKHDEENKTIFLQMPYRSNTIYAFAHYLTPLITRKELRIRL